jgi:hypothetical protein
MKALWRLEVGVKLHTTSFVFTMNIIYISGLGSSVGMAKRYGLDGPRIESRWGRGFLHLSRPALVPTQPPVQWVQGLSRG